jgi:hypothetical protein
VNLGSIKFLGLFVQDNLSRASSRRLGLLTWRYVWHLLVKWLELADNGQWEKLSENPANFALSGQNDLLING